MTVACDAFSGRETANHLLLHTLLMLTCSQHIQRQTVASLLAVQMRFGGAGQELPCDGI